MNMREIIGDDGYMYRYREMKEVVLYIYYMIKIQTWSVEFDLTNNYPQ